MIIKIPHRGDELVFRSLAVEYDLIYEKLDEGNYIEDCPSCGEHEFWHNGHCRHCGFDLKENKNEYT